MQTANPCARGGVGHPDRATPPGSQCRQQVHACSLMVLENPNIAVQHQITSSLQDPWWQCYGKLSQEMSELASPPLSTPPPPCYNSPYFHVKHQPGSMQTYTARAQDVGLCHPMTPGFPQLGELHVPSCARDTLAEPQPITLLREASAPAHPA